MLFPELSSAQPYAEQQNRMLPPANVRAVNIVIVTDVCEYKLWESRAFPRCKCVREEKESNKDVIHNELVFVFSFTVIYRGGRLFICYCPANILPTNPWLWQLNLILVIRVLTLLKLISNCFSTSWNLWGRISLGLRGNATMWFLRVVSVSLPVDSSHVSLALIHCLSLPPTHLPLHCLSSLWPTTVWQTGRRAPSWRGDWFMTQTRESWSAYISIRTGSTKSHAVNDPSRFFCQPLFYPRALDTPKLTQQN